MPKSPPEKSQRDDTNRRELRARIASERAYFLELMRDEPEGFLGLLKVLTGKNPKKALRDLRPEATELVFQLAAMQCVDIVAEAESWPE